MLMNKKLAAALLWCALLVKAHSSSWHLELVSNTINLAGVRSVRVCVCETRSPDLAKKTRAADYSCGGSGGLPSPETSPLAPRDQR